MASNKYSNYHKDAKFTIFGYLFIIYFGSLIDLRFFVDICANYSVILLELAKLPI